MNELDRLDAEEIEQAIITPGYARLRERYVAMLEQARIRLEQPAPAEETARLRGEVAALRVVLRLPDMLIAESRGKRQ